MEEYQQRVLDEKKELDSKIDKLGEFIGSDEFVSVPMAEQVRLKQQRTVMNQYSDILAARIDGFA